MLGRAKAMKVVSAPPGRVTRIQIAKGRIADRSTRSEGAVPMVSSFMQCSMSNYTEGWNKENDHIVRQLQRNDDEPKRQRSFHDFRYQVEFSGHQPQCRKLQTSVHDEKRHN